MLNENQLTSLETLWDTESSDIDKLIAYWELRLFIERQKKE